MKKWTILLLTLLFATLWGANELPLEEFMQRVRAPHLTSTYAALEGTIQHRRTNEEPRSESIYFAVILQPERMTGQIIVGGKEGYLIGQTRNSGNSETSVVPMRGSREGTNPLLGYMGVRPSDLTMSFIFYPIVKELPSGTVKGIPCRVVLLEAPDKSEFVQVYIAKSHYFPLKAVFLKPGETTPYRTLEVNAFKQKNDLYYTEEISLYGPGWRTRINFDKSANVGVFAPGDKATSVIIRNL
ncbi:MAG: outer membrane lipoprotein-sorting protein [Victivallales bacterium]|nr:outer membrane lipoprotein-sorting protein [Victivallales bacterium]